MQEFIAKYMPYGELQRRVREMGDIKPDISISDDGYWVINGEKTNFKAEVSEAPVQSVNGKTGEVNLSASDVGARPNTWTPTYAEVGADKAGTADTAVNGHNTNTSAHNDIRLALVALSDRINHFFDTDDTTLDQASEIVAYIKSNKTLIDAITTSKVSVSDIINNLTTNVTDKPLSAAQGVTLKALIDALSTNKLDASALTSAINTALAQAKASGEFDGKDGADGSNGKDGTSVTITNVSESTADGGSNVVTFSNGQSITIKNGSKGSAGKDGTNGTNGTNGKDGVDGKDYVLTPTDLQEIKEEILSTIITQEAGESTSLVMSQKAVTDLVADALGNSAPQYETVDSVEEMTDTSKSYVLSSTGNIWTYGEVTVVVEPPNKLVVSTAEVDKRLSGSSGSVSTNASSVGCFVTDFIEIDKGMADISPYNVRLNWEIPDAADNKVVFYNSSKSRIGNTVISPTSNATISNGETVVDIKTIHTTSSAAPSNWADVGYIRLQLFVNSTLTAITKSDIANYTIKFDAEGGTTTGYQWYDTGLKPSASGGDGGNYVDLLVKVNENKTDIAEINKRVIALETDSGTLEIPEFWQTAVNNCIAKIKALQVGINCITFPFFSDNHQRNGYAGMLIAYIMKECNIPYCFYGGDSISSGYIESEAAMIAEDKAFDTIMSYVPNGRLCRAVGNHDGYWNDGTNKHYYTREQIYELFLREESIAQNKHFGDDGTYYYIDDIASKVRFIVLNTNGTVDSTQLLWLQNTALSFNESGWAVVFISHQPISNHYHALISNAAEVRTVVKNYINGSATNKAAVVGWFSGHIHRDRIYSGIATNTEDDTEGEAMGFKQVTITSDATAIAYDDATKHPTANDDKSHAIDFVTINKATRKVNLTRLGIGSDRSYTY